MEEVLVQIARIQIFSEFALSLFLLIPLVLISRTVVTGTKYSPILLIVIFGLMMGYALVAGGVSEPGLPDFHIVDVLSQTTIIALMASFFVGGQELRKLISKLHVEPDTTYAHSEIETSVGTTLTQLLYIIRAFLLLLGLEVAHRAITGNDDGAISRYYPLLAYIGLAGSILLVDFKAKIQNKKLHMRRGVVEMFFICLIMIATDYLSSWIKPTIALPQIFFAMLITCGLGAVFYKWRLGATLRALLFAGLPIVLAANFLIGGSRITEVIDISGMHSVLGFGFFGQLTWMFGGIALIMIFGKTAHVRNLAPALAGGLSHAGLTGACTAGDLGPIAASRAPIMINIPFLAHIFVFSILAVSAERGSLLMGPALAVLAVGAVLTIMSKRGLRLANGNDGKEIKGLMLFSLGWQLVAMFGGFILLSLAGMPLGFTAVAATSSLSHFGLFAATQGGMFGLGMAELLPFIFAMPFLVHPFVFYVFGKAMDKDGHLHYGSVFVLAGVGIAGVACSLAAV